MKVREKICDLNAAVSTEGLGKFRAIQVRICLKRNLIGQCPVHWDIRAFG